LQAPEWILPTPTGILEFHEQLPAISMQGGLFFSNTLFFEILFEKVPNYLTTEFREFGNRLDSFRLASDRN